MRALVGFFTKVYGTIAGTLAAHVALTLAAAGVVVLLIAAYHYGRHVQHDADLDALGESYQTGYSDGMVRCDQLHAEGGRIATLNDAQVRVTEGGVEVRGTMPVGAFPIVPGDWPMSFAPMALTSWRDVPAELKAADAVRDWRAERGLVAE